MCVTSGIYPIQEGYKLEDYQVEAFVETKRIKLNNQIK